MKTHTKRLAVIVALTAVTGASVFGGNATADPMQLTALVGVGSDTTQEVMNAMAGRSNNIDYDPLHSSSASGYRQLISFDATPPAGVSDSCITPKVGGPTFTRPNGSSGGRKALSRAMDGTKYGSATCGGVQDVAGLVDFARSSSGPSSGDTGTDLTYIPFGRDALSFGYYRANGSPVTSLTKAQLTTLFTSGPQDIDADGSGPGTTTVKVIPCGIQTNSGTYASWNTLVGVSSGTETTAVGSCTTGYGRLQESDAAGLKAAGDALDAAEDGVQVIVGFSAGVYIAKANGVSAGADPIANNVGIGSISDNGIGTDLGSPIDGTAPNLTPDATFFGDSTFGRSVYNVFPTSVVTSAFGNDDIKSMFVGSSSSLCLATTTIEAFGFLVHPSCGSTSTKGSKISGQL